MSAPTGAGPVPGPGSAGPVLDIRDLRVSFPTRRGPASVVNGLDLAVAPGETVAVVGESGSGKSVSMLAALGLLPAAAHVAGSVRLAGEELLGAPASRLRRIRGQEIGMVFQDPMTSLNPVLTVRRQLVEGMAAHGRRRDALGRARHLLGEVGLPDPDRALRAYPHQLSGGMRQRVVIAMALLHDPAVLVADEATTALDVTVQAQILRLVADLRAEHGTGVVWITHDLGVVAGIADRVVVMYGGRCIETGPVDAVFAAPAHPYTRGLLASLPSLEGPGDGRPVPGGGPRELVAMPGLPPDPVALPEGCAFWPRCPVRSDPRCESERPSLREVSPGASPAHRVATWGGESVVPGADPGADR